MFVVARAAIKSKSKVIREFYMRLRKRGKHYLSALIAVARKILVAIWHILTSGKPWSENIKRVSIPMPPRSHKKVSVLALVKLLVSIDYSDLFDR